MILNKLVAEGCGDPAGDSVDEGWGGGLVEIKYQQDRLGSGSLLRVLNCKMSSST